MGLSKTGAVKKPREKYLVKRCPNCSINLPIDATQCYSCKTKVGDVDRHGKARKKINWYSYLAAIVSWGAFAFYIKWAFL
jgi:hypothetical protein